MLILTGRATGGCRSVVAVRCSSSRTNSIESAYKIKTTPRWVTVLLYRYPGGSGGCVVLFLRWVCEGLTWGLVAVVVVWVGLA